MRIDPKAGDQSPCKRRRGRERRKPCEDGGRDWRCAAAS